MSLFCQSENEFSKFQGRGDLSDKGQGYYNHLASNLFPCLQQTVIGSNKMHDLCMSGREVQDCAEQVSPLAECLHNKGSNRII